MRENTRIDFSVSPSAARSAFLTYEPYYGLKEKPFSLSADPRFLYKSRSHAPTFDELRAGIRRREGLIVLTGEPGTGKTTLCRAVLEGLDRKTFCTMVPDPFVSRDDLLKMLLLDFGVMSVEDLKSGRLNTASRPELSYPLYEFLRSLVPLQAYAVLIIDEAQNLSPQLLEEIRILSDLEAPEKLLQLVLVGQPELRTKLKDHAMRQVDQRVSVRVELSTLDREGVGEYIAHRLDVAGGGADRVTFSSDALDVIFKATKGNPRLINLACDKSLHHGHLARTFIIGPDVVTRSLTELGMLEPAAASPTASPAPPPPAPVQMQAPAPVPARVPPPAPTLVAPVAPVPAQPTPSVSSPSAPITPLPTVAPSLGSSALTPAPAPAVVPPPHAPAPAMPSLAASVAPAPSPAPAAATPSLQPVTPPAPTAVPKPAPSLAPVPAPSQATATVVKPDFKRREPERDTGLESIDDFGLGESFFERPISVDDVPGETEEPPLFTSSGNYEPPSPNRRRTVLVVLGCVLLPALIAALVWWWQQRAFDISALPALPPVPVRDMAIRAAKPPVTVEQLAAAQQTGNALYEVGVALFSGYERASGLAVELAAAGFRASTRSIDSAKGRLYEVRTGPYFSHDAAEADAARIRQIPGYADARVVPPPSDVP